LKISRTFLGFALGALTAAACGSPEPNAEGTSGSSGQSMGAESGTAIGGHTSGASGANTSGGKAGASNVGGASASAGVAGTIGTSGAIATGGGTNGGGASATAGTAGTAGGAMAGSGGGGSAPVVCKFASGLNVAWVNFANDIPNPKIATFQTIFKNTHDAGGRVIRWWLHTNGAVTPGYNSDGTVKNLQQSHVDGIKAVLNAAHAVGVLIDLSLWSFDMAQDNAMGAAANNKNLMTDDKIRQSYADNYLTPLVKALKGTPGLYSYEIFNEPEGMSTTGWATQWKIDISYIQKAVNQWAAAIHEADPTALVTNGSQTMDYRTKYTDSALIAAGGKAKGTLDFYQVHFYQVNGQANNVFANPRTHWGLPEKKLVIGEFSIDGSSPASGDDSYTNLFTNGYDGAWAWAYTADNKWPSMQKPLSNLYAAQKATIEACQ
jgi:hypothetical protein